MTNNKKIDNKSKSALSKRMRAELWNGIKGIKYFPKGSTCFAFMEQEGLCQSFINTKEVMNMLIGNLIGIKNEIKNKSVNDFSILRCDALLYAESKWLIDLDKEFGKEYSGYLYTVNDFSDLYYADIMEGHDIKFEKYTSAYIRFKNGLATGEYILGKSMCFNGRSPFNMQCIESTTKDNKVEEKDMEKFIKEEFLPNLVEEFRKNNKAEENHTDLEKELLNNESLKFKESNVLIILLKAGLDYYESSSKTAKKRKEIAARICKLVFDEMNNKKYYYKSTDGINNYYMTILGKLEIPYTLLLLNSPGPTFSLGKKLEATADKIEEGVEGNNNAFTKICDKMQHNYEKFANNKTEEKEEMKEDYLNYTDFTTVFNLVKFNVINGAILSDDGYFTLADILKTSSVSFNSAIIALIRDEIKTAEHYSKLGNVLGNVAARAGFSDMECFSDIFDYMGETMEGEKEEMNIHNLNTDFSKVYYTVKNIISNEYEVCDKVYCNLANKLNNNMDVFNNAIIKLIKDDIKTEDQILKLTEPLGKIALRAGFLDTTLCFSDIYDFLRKEEAAQEDCDSNDESVIKINIIKSRPVIEDGRIARFKKYVNMLTDYYNRSKEEINEDEVSSMAAFLSGLDIEATNIYFEALEDNLKKESSDVKVDPSEKVTTNISEMERSKIVNLYTIKLVDYCNNNNIKLDNDNINIIANVAANIAEGSESQAIRYLDNMYNYLQKYYSIPSEDSDSLYAEKIRNNIVNKDKEFRSIENDVVGVTKSVKKLPVIALVGSSRFKDEFKKIELELTMQGYVVLSLAGFSKCGDFSEDDRDVFDKVHCQKVDMADYILVINKDGYIGDHTAAEIRYALSTGKNVYFLNEYEIIKDANPRQFNPAIYSEYSDIRSLFDYKNMQVIINNKSRYGFMKAYISFIDDQYKKLDCVKEQYKKLTSVLPMPESYM